tara:strand:- start:713 stop:1198 length:486 start_codon:yes stop_codon:yes gene_type:complete
MNYSCEICGKEFKENGQKYRPKYQLNEHKKTCFTKFKKKQRRFIKDYSQNASDIEINRLYEFIKNPNSFYPKQQQEQEQPQCTRILTESPKSDIYDEESIPERPSSNDSISTNNSEIETESFYYDGYTYDVDKKNRVYDRDGNKIGYRYKDQWSEYRLVYD